jgi:hypothetical protein
VGLLQVSGTAFATSYFRVGAVGSTAYSGGIENASNTSKSISIEADPTNSGANSLILFKIDNTERMRMTTTGLTTTDYAANNQYSAAMSARKVGASFEFGHQNTAGYGSTLGAHSSGISYLAFACGPGTVTNSYRTYGRAGSVLTDDGTGGFSFGSVTTTTGDSLTATERVRITGGGEFKVGSGLTGTNIRDYTIGGFGAIYNTNITPTANNYSLAYNGVSTYLSGVTDVNLAVNGVAALSINTGGITVNSTTFEMHSVTDYCPQIRAVHIGNTPGSGPYYMLRRARTGTTAVVNGDYLGTLLFSGYDGAAWDTSAYILGQVDGTVSAGSVPTNISFWTGATTPAERLRIASDGRIYVAGFATRPNGSQLQVNTSITCYGLHTAATSAISVGSVTCHDTSSTWQSLNMYYHGSTESGYLDYCPTVPKALAAELIAVNSNALVITTNTGPVVIGTQATERLRLDAGGYFGVGTAGAIANTYDQVASQRHVFVGSSTATTVANGTGGVAIVNSATTTNNLSSLAFAARTGSNLNYFASGHIQVQHGARVDGQYHAGTMIFSVAAGSNLAPTERLRIESNGNITNANTTATVGGKAFTWNNSDTGAGSYVQHVVSTNAGSFITQIGSTANGGLASLYSSASGGMMFYTTNATSLSLGTNNVSSRLVLNSSGGVTVGAKGTAGVLRLEAMNGVAEGGEMSFGGASTYPDIGMDNYAGTLRTSNIGGVRSILVDDGNFQFGNTPAVNTLRYFDIYNVDTGVNTGTNLRFITKNAANSATVAVDLVKYRSGAFYITNNEPSSTGVINLGAYSATQVQIVPVSGALNYIKFSGSVSGNPTISTNAGNLAITPNIDAAGSVNSGVAADPVVKNYYSTCTQSAVATEWGGYYHANAGHATSTLKATARFVMNYTSNRNASTNTQAVGIINSVTGAYDVSLLQGLSVSVGATAAFTTGKVIGNATGLQVGMTNDGVGLITNVIGVAIGDYVTTTGTPILGGGVYGLYSTISSGAGRWNIYSIGTAASYHAGEFQFARNMTMLSVNAGTFNAGDWSRDANWGTYYKGFAGTVANVAFVNNAGTAIWGVGAKGAGYFAGSGGAVAQGTSRTTSVTLNKVCGSIVLVTAAGTTAWQQFTVSNSMVEANDVIIVNYKDTLDLYEMHVKDVAAGSFKIAYRTTGGTTVEEPIFHFAVIKAVTL